MTVYYIGADVHSNNTELAVEEQGRIVQRHSVATTVQAIRQVLEKLDGRKHLALEEGPLAGWLYRNLVDHVDSLVVCDPRRNKSIACDGDKDDRIDAAKLAGLLRGNYVRAVHHSRDEQMVRLKRWVRMGPPNAIHRVGDPCTRIGSGTPRVRSTRSGPAPASTASVFPGRRCMMRSFATSGLPRWRVRTWPSSCGYCSKAMTWSSGP